MCSSCEIHYGNNSCSFRKRHPSCLKGQKGIELERSIVSACDACQVRGIHFSGHVHTQIYRVDEGQRTVTQTCTGMQLNGVPAKLHGGPLLGVAFSNSIKSGVHCMKPQPVL